MKIILTIALMSIMSCTVNKEDLDTCERICKGKMFKVKRDIGIYSCECTSIRCLDN
jgi:hypothetical protein